KNGYLIEQFGGRDVFVLKLVRDLAFVPIGYASRGKSDPFVFAKSGNQIVSMIFRRGANETLYLRGRSEEAKVTTGKKIEERPASPTVSADWPSFRGIQASGVADGQHLPVSWDVATGRNILWKTPIPGLGHSCPVVWKGKVFLTTAVSSAGKSDLK